MLVAHAAGPRLGLLIAAISARSSRSPKKVHLHNGARARPPGVALGALRADVGVARYGPLPSSRPFDALSRPIPVALRPDNGEPRTFTSFLLYISRYIPGGFIIVPRYMCPPLHLALWGLMGPSQGCTLHRRLYAPPPAPQSPWFERSGGFGRPRAPHGGALRATFRTRICSFQAYRGCKSVVTDLMTHAHGLVRLPAARITRETFNCSNPCTERGKMGAECKGDQISAYQCIVS